MKLRVNRIYTLMEKVFKITKIESFYVECELFDFDKDEFIKNGELYRNSIFNDFCKKATYIERELFYRAANEEEIK